MEEFKLNSIEEAIADIQAGKVVIVVDDEDRENEGDFLTAARNATPEVVNFMATHGRGLICAPLTEKRCEELGLNLMVQQNSATYETPFTISVDLIKFTSFTLIKMVFAISLIILISILLCKTEVTTSISERVK